MRFGTVPPDRGDGERGRQRWWQKGGWGRGVFGHVMTPRLFAACVGVHSCISCHTCVPAVALLALLLYPHEPITGLSLRTRTLQDRH